MTVGCGILKVFFIGFPVMIHSYFKESWSKSMVPAELSCTFMGADPLILLADIFTSGLRLPASYWIFTSLAFGFPEYHFVPYSRIYRSPSGEKFMSRTLLKFSLGRKGSIDLRLPLSSMLTVMTHPRTKSVMNHLPS